MDCHPVSPMSHHTELEEKGKTHREANLSLSAPRVRRTVLDHSTPRFSEDQSSAWSRSVFWVCFWEPGGRVEPFSIDGCFERLLPMWLEHVWSIIVLSSVCLYLVLLEVLVLRFAVRLLGEHALMVCALSGCVLMMVALFARRDRAVKP